MIYPLEYILLLYSGLRIGGDKMKNLKQDIIFYLDQNEELKKIIDLEKEFKNILFS